MTHFFGRLPTIWHRTATTQADLLADFQRWNNRNSNKSPLRFLEKLLIGWGIEPINWFITDENEVKKTRGEQPFR